MAEYTESTVLETSDDVLKYWFGSNYFTDGNSGRNSVAYIKSRISLWFMHTDAVFDAVQANNKQLLDKLEEIHKTDNDWNTLTGALAKILVFDQFSRTVYKGTANAFKYDNYCKETVEYVLSRNWFLEYSAVERLFITVALQHYESLEVQTLGVGLGKLLLCCILYR